MAMKLGLQTFMDLTKVSCLVGEFKQAVTMKYTRPSLLSHRSMDIKELWGLHKKDIKAATAQILHDVRNAGEPIEALIQQTLANIDERVSDIMRDKIQDEESQEEENKQEDQDDSSDGEDVSSATSDELNDQVDDMRKSSNPNEKMNKMGTKISQHKMANKGKSQPNAMANALKGLKAILAAKK